MSPRTHKEEDHDKRQHVQPSIEAERANDAHHMEHGRERDRQDGGVEQARRDGPCHALFTVGQGKHFGTVSERNRSFTRRVERAKDVHEQGDETKVRGASAWNKRTQAGSEK